MFVVWAQSTKSKGSAQELSGAVPHFKYNTGYDLVENELQIEH